MVTPPKRFGVTRTMFRGDALALCTSSAAAALSYLKRDTSTVFNALHCAATQSKHCIGRGEEEKLSGALVGDKST